MIKIIFDLDGTLADCTHRLHYIKNGKKNWKSFFIDCDKDTPIWPTIKILQSLTGNNNILVDIWTGRSEIVRAETEHWLYENGINVNYLRMRPLADRRPAPELKESWLNMYGPIYCVFEDDPRVVKMWRDNGVVCYQVNEGHD